MLENAGRTITKWGAYDAVIDGQTVFIRPSSLNPKGWQITFRDRFLAELQTGDGLLLVPRNGVLLIPLKEVDKVIKEKDAFEQNTIDIWIVFGACPINPLGMGVGRG